MFEEEQVIGFASQTQHKLKSTCFPPVHEEHRMIWSNFFEISVDIATGKA